MDALVMSEDIRNVLDSLIETCRQTEHRDVFDAPHRRAGSARLCRCRFDVVSWNHASLGGPLIPNSHPAFMRCCDHPKGVILLHFDA